METINFTNITNIINIKNIRKLKQKHIFIKNIFYIKLLVYFEDLEFIKYMNLKSNCFLWTVYILDCLIKSKCSNKFIDLYIEFYYIKHNLSKRLKHIIKLTRWNDIIDKSKIVKKFSFYEKEKYAELSIRSGISPTILLINKISSVDHLLDLSIKYNRWDCLIDMYLSKYISKDILVIHLPKCIKYFEFNLEKPRKKINRLISVCEKTPELANSGNFLLELMCCMFTIYNKNLHYYLVRLSTIVTNFFKTELYHVILSNQKVCDKFIETSNDFYSDFSIESIINSHIFGTNFKTNIYPIYKTNITNSFIVCTSKTSIPENTLIYLINNFKLETIHIQTIFKHLNPEYDHLVDLLKKPHYINMKNYLIDMQGSAYPEIKCAFFKYFIKYKLLSPNEIRHFILDNINSFKHWNIRKFVRNFEDEYVMHLKSNILVSSNCLWVLYYYYKIVNDEIITAVFDHIFKKNEQTYIYYDIIEGSIISGYSLRKIQNIFIKYFEQIKINFKDNWVIAEIFEYIFITNVYLDADDSLIKLLETNKRLFEKSLWKKISSTYKV